MTARRILVGEIGRPHGVRGLVKLRSFCVQPDAVAAYGPLTDEAGVRVLGLTLLADGIARIEGVADRDAAARLTGTRLYAERDRLPPPDDDEYYFSDLIGLRAEAADGAPLGRITAVEDFSAGAILVLDGDRMVPFTRAAVPVVDVAAGRVVIAPPEEIAGETEAAA